MRRLSVVALAALAMSTVRYASPADTPQTTLLRLVQTIPIPNVKGRLDHMDADVEGRRLFVAGLENGSLEVVDLRAGKWSRSIPGFKKPQGIWHVPRLKKLFVASGDDGMVRVFRDDTLALLDSIKLDLGPNRVNYDPRTSSVYVGYGGKDAGKDYGQVGIIDGRTDQHLGDIRVAAHPAEILLDTSGQRIFVANPAAQNIQVLDAKKREVLKTWPTRSERPSSMAFDETRHRLFVGTHKPPELLVYDTESGQEVAGLPTVEGLDGLSFDAARNRIYVSGGRGFQVGSVYVYQHKDADRYDLVGQVPTRASAGTSHWVPQLDRYYVAAPASDSQTAAILVFQPQP